MEDAFFETLIRAIIAVGSAICTAIPLVSALIKACKEKKFNRKAAEKEIAINDMLEYVNQLISSAEEAFAQLDILLKQHGESAGILKKESVMSKLLAYAVSKNYAFDEVYWSEKIDEIVKFTRTVNAKT